MVLAKSSRLFEVFKRMHLLFYSVRLYLGAESIWTGMQATSKQLDQYKPFHRQSNHT